jgi:hypothetical protein
MKALAMAILALALGAALFVVSAASEASLRVVAMDGPIEPNPSGAGCRVC